MFLLNMWGEFIIWVYVKYLLMNNWFIGFDELYVIFCDDIILLKLKKNGLDVSLGLMLWCVSWICLFWGLKFKII